MTVDEIVQIVMDVVEKEFDATLAMTPESTIKSLGLDSLQGIELVLALEMRFPNADLFDYAPEVTDTIRDVATEVEKRFK